MAAPKEHETSAMEFFRLDDDKCSRLDLESLPDLLFFDRAFVFVGDLLFHAGFRAFLQHVKTDGPILYRRVKLEGDSGRAHLQLAFPH